MNYNHHKATRLILSELVSSLSLCLQKMGADRIRDDVKTEALAADWAEGQVPGIYGC